MFCLYLETRKKVISVLEILKGLSTLLDFKKHCLQQEILQLFLNSNEHIYGAVRRLCEPLSDCITTVQLCIAQVMYQEIRVGWQKKTHPPVSLGLSVKSNFVYFTFFFKSHFCIILYNY